GAWPKTQRTDQHIKEKSAVTARVNSPFLEKKTAHYRSVDRMRQFKPHRFAAQPVRRNFDQAAEKIDNADLKPKEPQRPRWCKIGTERRPQPVVHLQSAVRGNK